MLLKNRMIALLFVMLWPGISFAQQSDIQFNHITIEDGLSQNTVQAIAQDHEGYMWFGTQDGLNRYNGYDLTVYKQDMDDSTSINGNDIRVIYEDSDNRLWIGTQSGALNLYDREKDRFENYEAIDEDWRTLSSNAVWAILEDSHDVFWVGTSYGLNIMDRETGVVQRIFSEEENPETLSSNQITSFFEDSEGTLWVGTANGLNRYNRQDSTFTRFLNNTENVRNQESYYINTIYEDNYGNFWIGTEENGLLLFNREDGTHNSYSYNENDPDGLNDNSVVAFIENEEGDLWVGTGNQGLNRMDQETKTFTAYKHQPVNPSSLSNNGINYLYQSRDGFLWVGTFAGGVNFVDPDPPSFQHFKNEPVNPNSLSNNVVQSFYQGRNGDIWIGTDGGGLNRFDTETRKFEHFRHNPESSNSISSDVILDIYQDEMGLWLGTYGGGVSLFDARTGRGQTFRNRRDGRRELSSDFVFAISPKSDGTLWFGTNLGGVTVFDPATETFEWYVADPDQPADPNTIGNNDVRSIFEDSNGDMWIGAYGGVLNRYDNDEERFYAYDINRNSNLYGSVVQHIHEDREGRLWLATRGGGLKRFDLAGNRFLTYSEEDGMPSNIVHSIEEDGSGNLWISTNNGLSRFNPETEDFQNYHTEDGIQSQEFNPGASLKDRDGFLYFGGVNGFNRFHPALIKVDSHVPPVVLTDLQLFNRTVPVAENSPLQKQISQAESITFPHDASVITFEYAAMDYSTDKNNQFAYMLEGFDQEWNYVGEIRRATYTNLSPGEYTFRVKVANNDGVWSEQGTSLAVVITPPFWRTAWFLGLMVLVITGMIYFIYRLRVRAIRNRNRMLATLISKRTQELEKANATKDKLFSIIAHDLINISTGLSGLSGLMQESLEENNLDEVKEYSKHLHHTINQFATMLKNMLDWARSQTGKIQYEPIRFLLSDIVEETISQQESRVIQKNIELTSSVDENLEVYADPDMVLVILRNLVGNAMKFTPEEGKIEIHARETEGAVEISVSDSGVGMSEEQVQKVFYSDESITTLGTSNEKGTGLGISLCKDFIQKNRGELKVKSKPDVGTTITFTLPVAQEMEEYEVMTQAS